MIIQAGKIVSNKDQHIKHLNILGADIYYKGFIFVAGKKAGQESLEYLVNKMTNISSFPFKEIFGHYFVYLIDNNTHKQYIFTDNSGLFIAYKYKNCISTSFIEIIDHFQDITINDLDHESIVETFHLSYPYFYKTLIKGIIKTDETFYYSFIDDELTQQLKNIDPISFPPNISMDKFFNILCYSLQNHSVALDLTGGSDSRLIVSYFLKENMDFELGISAQESNRELEIAEKVASKINKKFFPSIHKAENYSEKDIKKNFYMTDAQADVLIYHHSDQMNKERLSRNVEIQVGGAGGELYKDFWWLQDFPFYNRTKANIKKLYNQRFESTRFNHYILDEKLIPYSLNLRRVFIEKLQSFSLGSNTQTYDNIIQNTRAKVSTGVYTSIAANYFLSYSPLLEREVIKIGFNAKRSMRFYNRLHRKWITNNCKEISTIRTTENITTSSLILYQLLDILYYIPNRGQRIIKQILRKILNKTYLQQASYSVDLFEKWKNNPFYHRHVQLLKEHHILNNNIKIHEIPDNLMGKISTIGFLIEKLNDPERHNL